MQKSLDTKIANIRANPTGAKDFILADAKDADMAFGLASPGVDPQTGKTRSLANYRDQIREIARSGLVDIMLMSASTSEILTIKEKLFANSPVTPACRANDTTDVHVIAGSNYIQQPSRPFRTATLEQIMYGQAHPAHSAPKIGADLGLYSITLNNNLAFDYDTLLAYKDFRLEAELKGFRHFLEVFDPNACADACPKDIGRFLGDLIARTLAGVPSTGRPVFLKIPYHGPAAMEALVHYDPYLIPGVLGGSAGTTHDAFWLLHNAKKHGARAALFGRKINTAEHQLTFVTYLKRLADGLIEPADAVKAYHADLARMGLKPLRDLKTDLELTSGVATSYGGSGGAAASPKPTPAPTPVPEKPKYRLTEAASGATSPKPKPRITESASPASRTPVRTSVIPAPAAAPASVKLDNLPTLPNGSPDFKKMTSTQKVAYHRAKIQSDLARHNA